LRAPAGPRTRPTSEKVREAIFAIVGDLANTHVLDLFAGSGALGLEALSRGAAHATFVDSARAARDAIAANIATLGVAARASVIGADAVAFLAQLRPHADGADAAAPRDAGQWRLVLVDPPYASDLGARVLAALPVVRLAPDAVIVVEHDRRHAPPDAVGSLLRTDLRRYGDTMISLYRVVP
jgi:16S rRNA (guanine966-N2)-methyltransferase